MQSQELGDYIGVESCLDFSPDVPDAASHGGGARRSRRSDAAAVAPEYPPPISLLARAENLPSYMMKRYRTSDGRLVITEERARRHQYFTAHRSGGRLVLSLIPVDEEGSEDEKLGCQRNAADSGGGGDERVGDPPLEEIYIGVKPCGGGFGVALPPGLMPPVLT